MNRLPQRIFQWHKAAFIALLFAPLMVQAGGIALGSTRVIYPADKKQVSLAVINSDDKTRFLIQSWVDDNRDKKTGDFVITPPLFTNNPKSENTLRIMYVGPGTLPQDRESVFWVNVKAIPAAERSAVEGRNVLQLAVLSRIKLFWRPVGLTGNPADAPAELRFRQQGRTLTINNPSAYHVSLVNLWSGAHKLPNTMVAPKSSASLTLPSSARGEVRYQTVNDYGATTPSARAVMQ
ncbi:fimbria/pilus periplasmic chaperone [Entomohabitans teleogrylli]|uniref:fimbria/pilus periplasmic chaperone n=1 Tax=Entomohabitans teleogrylli TaxID=1384589 RepID=UPI000AFB170A|nr:fimbria/pilus periplasmic chaperone [Entomohabitans teleogrylli]